MKILPAVVLFLINFFSSQLSFGQENALQNQPFPVSQMRDTTIILDHSFIVRNRYATKDSLTAIKKASVQAVAMHDTTIILDQSFVVRNIYSTKDSLAFIRGRPLTKRDSLIRAIRDSLNALGNALMRTVEMQDTTIALDPLFIVRDVYAKKDKFDAARDSIRALSSSFSVSAWVGEIS